MNKRNTADNRGFSLIEVLIAVVILAIAAAPILHSMLTAAKTASKARAYGNATLTAQNVIETVQAEPDLAALLNGDGSIFGDGASLIGCYQYEGTERKNKGETISYVTRVIDVNEFGGSKLKTVNTTVPDLAAGTVYLELRGLNSTGQNFSTVLSVDPSEFDEINYDEITSFTPMDIVFSQPSEENSNPDIMAASSFAYDALEELDFTSGVAANTAATFDALKSYFLMAMSRDITLDISLNDKGTSDTSDDVVCLSVIYDYSVVFDYKIPVEDAGGNIIPGEYTNASARYTLRHSYDSSLNGGSGNVEPAIYVFYFPNYSRINTANPSMTGYNEEIDINNRDNVHATVFLIKQDVSSPNLGYGLTSEMLTSYEVSYTARIDLYEKHNVVEDFSATVLSNIGTPIGTATTTGLITYRRYSFNELWYEAGFFSGNLVNTKPGMRIYRVSAAVYDSGVTDFASASPICSLSGSKLT